MVGDWAVPPVRPKQSGQKDFCSSPVIPLRVDKQKFNQILLAKQRKNDEL